MNKKGGFWRFRLRSFRSGASWKIGICYLVLAHALLSSLAGPSSAHSPHDAINALEISPDYDNDRTLFIVVIERLLKSTDGGFSWKQLGNGLDSYSPASIAISPSYQQDRTLFVSTDGDGIYKSESGGSSWKKVNRGLTNFNINLMAVSPDYRARKILLAAGAKGGLYKTDNGGESWRQVMADTITVSAIAFSPDLKQNHILAGDSRGFLHISRDGGDSWKELLKMSGGSDITSLAISPAYTSDGTFFIGTGNNGVYKADSGGSRLSHVHNGLTDSSVSSIVISAEYKRDSTVYISTWHKGMFRSTDSGKSWKRYSKGLTYDPQADTARFRSPQFMDLKIAGAHGKDPSLFLAGFDGLFRSVDGGHVWREMETLSAKRIQKLALSPDYAHDSTIALSTFDGGVYLSKDRGAHWEVLNGGLHETHLMDITFSPDFASDNTLFANSNSFFYRLEEHSKTWDRIELEKGPGNKPLFPLLLAVSPDFASDRTIFFGTRYLGIFRSVNKGVSWSPLWSKEPYAHYGKGRWITSLVISPDFVSDRTLYAGIANAGIFKTSNGGAEWQSLHTSRRFFNLLALSPHYKTDRTVFASTSEGLVRSEDGGKSWVETGGFGRNDYIEAVAVSSNYRNDKTVFVSVKGKGLFRSENRGQNFRETGSDLTGNNHTLKTIAFSPAYAVDNTMYGASDEELFRSEDSGVTWQPVARPVRYENTKDYIYYDGEWKVARDRGFSSMTVSRSESINSRAGFSFVGTGISLIGTTSNIQGIARVYIDGKLKGDIDQFSHTRKTMVTSYSVSDLPYGPHEIVIEVSGTRNSESRGTAIEIDAFDVEP